LDNPEKNTKEALLDMCKNIIEEYNKDTVGELKERSV